MVQASDHFPKVTRKTLDQRLSELVRSKRAEVEQQAQTKFEKSEIIHELGENFLRVHKDLQEKPEISFPDGETILVKAKKGQVEAKIVSLDPEAFELLGSSHPQSTKATRDNVLDALLRVAGYDV